MVLRTEHYPGGYNQNSYLSYEGPYGSYSNYQGVTEQTTPYPGYPQIISNYQSTHAHQQQSGWSTGGNYHADGGGHYSTNGGFGAPVIPILGGYGNSHYGSSYTHGSSHGFSHGNPNSNGNYGSPHGYGNSHSYGHSHGFGSGRAKNLFDKLTHGHSSYGHTSPNYGHHSAGGMNQPSWILKGLDDDE
uniref:glycine-rich RNA-binding protein 3, mitochondrial-like n=1 Tax=Erigeron canadensis TaxID=72917 RepID=UPI001CB95CA4|nr:glycine-rich RNA-binding protein 3, mitochondrial-like [Erigeron canadensis]